MGSENERGSVIDDRKGGWCFENIVICMCSSARKGTTVESLWRGILKQIYTAEVSVLNVPVSITLMPYKRRTLA